MKCFKFYFWFLILGIWGGQVSANNGYKISEISEELLNNATAVVRKDEMHLHLYSPSKASLKTHFAITILEEHAKDRALLQVLYNKFIKIKSLNGFVYDAQGKKIKTFKGKDIQDYSVTRSSTIYDDDRQKIIDPPTLPLPFTVEYIYETEYKSPYFLPRWYAQSSSTLAVEQSDFIVMVAPGNEIKYEEKNLANAVQISDESEGKKYHWSAKNLSTFTWEPYSLEPPVPQVAIALQKFDLEGYLGSFASWQKFGQWISQLNADKQNLPEETRRMLHQMTAQAGSDFEKIDLVYQYLQNKVRYVNISIGIGGLQPYDAATVDRLSYGDCKALTNYMQSCLTEVGVASYYTLVEAGVDARPINEDFPSHQFNHAFLCVPQADDTLWLECTDQLMPTGYSGTFTDDRTVLVINEQGGQLARTKVLGKTDNYRASKTEIQLLGGKAAKVERTVHYGGMYYEQMIPFLQYDDARVKKAVYEKIDLPQFILNDFAYEEKRSRQPLITEKLELSIHEYGSALGTKVFMPLNPMNRQEYIPSSISQRQTDIYIPRAYAQSDTVVYSLSESFTVEKLPKPMALQSDFGSYSFTIKQEGEQLIYIRQLAIEKGIFSKESYAEMVQFYTDVVAADKKKFLLKKVVRP